MSRLFTLLVAVTFVVFGSTALTACGPDVHEVVAYEKVVPLEKQKEASEFIRATVEAAYKEGHNGGELEDPEKVVREAKDAALEIYGEVQIGIKVWHALQRSTFIPYNLCSDRQKALCDGFMNEGKNRRIQ